MAMADITLKQFDAVLWLIRNAEEKYDKWRLNPPPAPIEAGGLFGLGAAPSSLVSPLPGNVPSLHIDDIRRTLTFVERLCGDIELEGGMDRVTLFREKLGYFISFADCFAQWRALREQIEKEIERRHIFYMKREATEQLLDAPEAWKSSFSAFPVIKNDVLCALRCFAFEQPTASIFHMMRVAEVGLRAVAKERKFKLAKDKPIEAAQWAELTSRLNTTIEQINNWKAKNEKKQPALAFYTAVRADTVFFKDNYRNLVSHSLAHFYGADARSVVHRVREFMALVSSRLDENAKPIRWTA